MTPKRKAVQEHILETIKLIEPDLNYDRYVKMFDGMNDAQFDAYMKHLKEGGKIDLEVPNMKISIKQENVYKAAKRLGLELFERLRLWDKINERYYLTPHKYLVILSPIRQLKQYLMDKMSVPEDDKKVDIRTGQVIKPDKGSSISSVQTGVLFSRGLEKSAVELIAIRGGNVGAYTAFTSSLEETGTVSQSQLNVEERAHSADMVNIYLKGAAIDNNA